MSMLSIAWKDLLILFKDRNNLIGTFLLPVVFIVIFIGITGLTASEEEEETELIPLPVVNHDAGGSVAELLVSNLKEQGGLEATVYPEAEAMDKLETEDFDRVLVIPTNFSADLATGKSTTLRLINNTLDRDESESVLMAVEGVTREMSLEQQIVASLTQLARMQAANPDFDPATSAEMAIPLARQQFEDSRGRPLVTVSQKQPDLGQEEEIEVTGVQIGVPGFAVLFVFLTAQMTARSIYDEKKTGSFRRLLAAPLGNWRLLIGKLLPNFLVVLLQVVFLFATGIFLLPLMGLDRLKLGNDILALVLLVLAVALCSTTLGVLIVAFAKTEAQIGGYTGVVLWVLAFLGGSFIPLFLINESMATIGKITPHYWAVTGFYDLLTRGQGLSAIGDSLAVLVLFALAFFAIGAWRFEFE